jgi:hypothetical protein
VRPVVALLAFLTACGSAPPRQQLPDDPQQQAYLADEDRYVPSYDKAELQKALFAERAQEATGERIVADLQAKADGAPPDPLRVALANLAVRRRFIAALEACEATGRFCPPRLDDPSWTYDLDGDRLDQPPLDVPLRFDADGWRAIAGELHGRGCACRTLGCVDSVGVAIDRLERLAPTPVVGDEAATLSITRARECLFRLRGKKTIARRPLPLD